MLTDAEKAGLAAMSQEQLLSLLALIRKVRAEFGHRGSMPASAVQAMVDVVDDKQMQQIVQEHRHGRSEPGGLGGPTAPTERRSGPVNPIPLGSPPGLR